VHTFRRHGFTGLHYLPPTTFFHHGCALLHHALDTRSRPRTHASLPRHLVRPTLLLLLPPFAAPYGYPAFSCGSSTAHVRAASTTTFSSTLRTGLPAFATGHLRTAVPPLYFCLPGAVARFYCCCIYGSLYRRLCSLRAGCTFPALLYMDLNAFLGSYDMDLPRSALTRFHLYAPYITHSYLLDGAIPLHLPYTTLISSTSYVPRYTVTPHLYIYLTTGTPHAYLPFRPHFYCMTLRYLYHCTTCLPSSPTIHVTHPCPLPAFIHRHLQDHYLGSMPAHTTCLTFYRLYPTLAFYHLLPAILIPWTFIFYLYIYLCLLTRSTTRRRYRCTHLPLCLHAFTAVCRFRTLHLLLYVFT